MSASVLENPANTSFYLALYKELREADRTANVFFSPFSISAAMAMVMLGAAGNTAAQMSEVLGFTDSSSQAEPPTADSSTREPLHAPSSPPVQRQRQQPSRPPSNLLKVFCGCSLCQEAQTGEEDQLHAKFAELLSIFNKSRAPYDLSLANRLFAEQSYQFVQEFLDNTKKYYSAELKSVDFQKNAEDVRISINAWVEKQTHGKLKDLLARGIVDNMTRLVLVNAIYFKGKWLKQFKVQNTVDGKFRINKTETRPVKMMQQRDKFRINTIPEVNSKILEMPYVGNELSMLILLPNEIEDETTGLEKLESELDFGKFEEWTRADMMGKNQVEVMLPRFKMEEKYDLNDVLMSMGMVDAFDVSRSDFSGMSPANDLVLSKVVHKAFVDVNEEGTEAAAATAGVLVERAALVPYRFIADHPFLFFIQHKPTKTVVFAGRYCSPE